ncbi:MAG: NAD(P)/FAD-dependent oxidoreductase [Magnetococcales bacterium]|nr:NAD(P)/FAD-dependent oxidoreductase [Magnetococcales bacterium]
MSKHILVVGGGLAGTMVANGLCRRLGNELRAGQVQITLLGTSDRHLYQPALLFVPFGLAGEENLFRSQRQVLDRRVVFHVDPARQIEAVTKKVTTEAGRVFDYDYLILATGSRLMPETVPGMVEGAHWFYDLAGARKLRSALQAFTGGRIVVNINVPHKCPVAPLEMTLMLHDYLTKRGLIDRTTLTYTYPIGRLHALEPVAHWCKPVLEQRGIQSETFFNTEWIDPVNQRITSMEGVTLDYDLLITIPPHAGMEVVSTSNLGRGGWATTDPKTLLHTVHKEIFVIGDTTNIPISKAGSTAHFETETVIANITALIQEGCWSHDYDGKVFCFLETGMEEGTYTWFNYVTPPRLGPPSQMIHWFRLAYNRLYWLSVKGLL